MITTKTHRIRTETLQQLRMIYAITGESQVAILARLVAAELARVQKQEVATTK
jgi:uncharacterized metal-binding protein